MISQKQMRKYHKYLGIVVGIQLAIWTISGLYFTLIPIEEIRGGHLLDKAKPVRIVDHQILSPSSILANHPDLREASLRSLRMGSRLDKPVYMISHEGKKATFDAVSGERVAALTKEEAIRLVKSRSPQEVQTARYVTEVEPGSEYRGGELPAWMLQMADDSHIYVGAGSAQITAVRTDEWRLFDFLWGLHIMDYNERENFNHWLLRIVSILAVVTVISGYVLYSLIPRMKARQRSAGQ